MFFKLPILQTSKNVCFKKSCVDCVSKYLDYFLFNDNLIFEYIYKVLQC